MKKYNKLIGSYGESLARDFLINNGYNILDMNYSNKYGEIDIICRSNNIIIFCEVKSRYTNSFGSPIESVTYYKQKQLIKLSQIYLLYKKYHNYNVRYDIIEIIFNNINASFTLSTPLTISTVASSNNLTASLAEYLSLLNNCLIAFKLLVSAAFNISLKLSILSIALMNVEALVMSTLVNDFVIPVMFFIVL